MTDANQINACDHDLRFPADDLPQATACLPSVDEFDAVEKLQETAESAGWSIDYRQLHPGELKIRSIIQEEGEFSVVRQTVSRHLEVIGEAPAGMMTIIIPISGEGLCVNGHKLNASKMAIVLPGTDTSFLTGSLLNSASIYVPTSIFEAYAHAMAPDWTGINNGNVITVKPRRDLFLAFRRQVISSLPAGTEKNSRKGSISALAAEAVSLISDPERISLCGYQQATSEIFRVLQRAREYIDSNLSERIRIADLCNYSCTSLSKLERTFQRELQMSPSQYILARRLAAAKRDLNEASSNGKQIAQIATDYCFNHLGRFAGVYRAHFGELPSETLRSSLIRRRAL